MRTKCLLGLDRYLGSVQVHNGPAVLGSIKNDGSPVDISGSVVQVESRNRHMVEELDP